MIDFNSFFQDKKVPDWFKNHAIFKDVKQATKIFPSIGLPNFEVESSLDISDHMTPYIRSLVYAMSSALNNVRYLLNPNLYDDYGRSAVHPDKDVQATLDLIAKLRLQFGQPELFVKQFAEKKNLYLVSDIMDDDNKVFAKAGEGLFKVYGKFDTMLFKQHKRHITNLDTMPAFKDYSSHNVASKDGKLRIVFSSDGNEGAWDILTMSMRGITSCQGWTGEYSKCTIGSVLDPYTGIMYLTSGSKTDYGIKMIRRCVIRFVVNPTTRQPTLFMEYMYPQEHPATMEAFKKLLHSKTEGKYPIVVTRTNSANYYVPYSSATKLLLKHSPIPANVNKVGYHNQGSLLPYRDCFMTYKLKDDAAILVEDTKRFKEQYLAPISTQLRKDLALRANYASLIEKTLATEVVDKINAEDYTDIAKYYRDICKHYFDNKEGITAIITKNIQSLMNKRQEKSITLVSKTKPKVIKSGKPVVKTKAKRSELMPKQIAPIITSTFKTAWKTTMALKKPRAKVKEAAA